MFFSFLFVVCEEHGCAAVCRQPNALLDVTHFVEQQEVHRPHHLLHERRAALIKRLSHPSRQIYCQVFIGHDTAIAITVTSRTIKTQYIVSAVQLTK